MRSEKAISATALLSVVVLCSMKVQFIMFFILTDTDNVIDLTMRYLRLIHRNSDHSCL